VVKGRQLGPLWGRKKKKFKNRGGVAKEGRKTVLRRGAKLCNSG